MIKKVFFITILTFLFGLTSFSQNSTTFIAMCREFPKIRKYQCGHLILKTDSSFYYEIISGDLPMTIESGIYFWTDNILSLKTKEHGIIKYLKKGNNLFLQNSDYSINMIKKLKQKNSIKD